MSKRIDTASEYEAHCVAMYPELRKALDEAHSILRAVKFRAENGPMTGAYPGGKDEMVYRWVVRAAKRAGKALRDSTISSKSKVKSSTSYRKATRT